MCNDRIMKCPVKQINVMKNQERGSFDYQKCGNILKYTEIVKWNDNSVVTLGSNAYRMKSIGTAKRWVKRKGRQNIKQLAVIAAFNKGIGGVDMLD